MNTDTQELRANFRDDLFRTKNCASFVLIDLIYMQILDPRSNKHVE